MAMFHHNNRYNKSCGPVKLPDGVVSFRIVCPASVVDGLFGRSCSIISGICRETECRIHCQEGVPGSDHQVILVVGSSSINRRIVFCDNNVIEEGGEVSGTQEAVIRVFDRMLEVEAEAEGEGKRDDMAYCGLLANTTTIGFIVGKGGRSVTRMRRESGAEIIMLPPPTCAAKDDELIQITGATMAVKKALVAVTACLQDLSLMEKNPVLVNRPIEKVYYSNSCVPHRECSPHLSLVPPLTGNSVDNASEFNSSSANTYRDSCPDKKGTKQEVALRMLVSDRAASGIIGKRGAIVRSLQDASGALISFAAPLTKYGERVVTISALENLDTRHSPVQIAAVLVFSRSVEVEGRQGFSSGANKGATVTARVLVGAHLVGYLTGNGNSVVFEMADVSGTDIKLLGGEQVLGCAAQNDIVVQITGAYKNVQNALSEVTGRLRQYLLSGEVLNEVRVRSPNGNVGGTTQQTMHQSVALSPEFEQETIEIQGVDQCGLPSKRSQRLQTKGRRHATPTIDGNPGSRMFGGSLEIEKSLVHLLPTQVDDEVGARSCFEGLGQTTASVLQEPSGQSPNSGLDNMLMEGVSQFGVSDNSSGPSTLQPPKTEGRGHRTSNTKGERSSTRSDESVEHESKMSASWDSKSNKIFLDLCVEEIRNGRRLKNTLTVTAWENVRRKFKESTGKDFTNKQFRNHWYALENDWKTFQSLKILRTKLGWQEENDIIIASEEWWSGIIQHDKKYAKFRNKELKHYELMEKVFGCISAIEKDKDTSNVELPHSSMVPTQEATQKPVDDLQVQIAFNDHTLRKDDTLIPKDGDKGKGVERKKNTSSTALNDNFDGLINVFESTSVSSCMDKRQSQIERAISILMDLSELEEGSPLQVFGVQKMVNVEWRQVFLALPKPELKLSFLKAEWEQSRGNASTSC